MQNSRKFRCVAPLKTIYLFILIKLNHSYGAFIVFLFICVAWYQYGTDRGEVFGTEVFVMFGGESGI